MRHQSSSRRRNINSVNYGYSHLHIVLIYWLILHLGYLFDRMSMYLDGSRTRDSCSKPYESLYGKRTYVCRFRYFWEIFMHHEW